VAASLDYARFISADRKETSSREKVE